MKHRLHWHPAYNLVGRKKLTYLSETISAQLVVKLKALRYTWGPADSIRVAISRMRKHHG